MLRGYRGIIFAALGWLILTGQSISPRDTPKADQHGIEASGGSDPQEAANTIAAAISNTVQPVVQDTGCQDRIDKRDSDLCAQWKAADAARDAAQYALATLLVSILGTGLLYWTFRETRLTSRRELRAYVYAEPTNLISYEKSKRVEAEYAIRNAGSTPAYDVIHGGGIDVLPVRDAKDFFDIQNADIRTGEETPVVIHAGQQAFGAVERKDFIIDEDMLRLLAGGGSALYVWGFVEYKDAFRRRRRGRFCYRLNGPRFASTSQESRRKPGTKVAMEWTMAPFHNDAT
jgi:hypothetical protein